MRLIPVLTGNSICNKALAVNIAVNPRIHGEQRIRQYGVPLIYG